MLHAKIVLDNPSRHAGSLISAGEAAHGELDVAAGQLAPAFHRTHIGRLRIAIEKVARLHPRRIPWQRKSLAQIAVDRLAPAGHPAREISRAKDHVATPERVTTGLI